MADTYHGGDVELLIAFQRHEGAVEQPVSGVHAKGTIRLFPFCVLRTPASLENNGFGSAG